MERLPGNYAITVEDVQNCLELSGSVFFLEMSFS